MRESEWQILIEDLETYYERKRASQETKDLWYTTGGIQQIPNEVGRWAYKKITDTYEMFPRNLPMVIRALWMDWQRANPHRIDKHHFQCRNSNCDRGWLWLLKQDVDREAEEAGVEISNPYALQPHTYVCPCGDCRMVEGRDALTMREAEDLGYRAWTQEEADEILRNRPKYDRSRWARVKFRDDDFIDAGQGPYYKDTFENVSNLVQNAIEGVGVSNDKGEEGKVDLRSDFPYLKPEGEANHGVVLQDNENGSANYPDDEPPIEAYEADADSYMAWDGEEVF